MIAPSKLLSTSLRVVGLLAAFFVIGETLMRVQRFGLAGIDPSEMSTIKRVLMSEFGIEPQKRDVNTTGSWGLMPNMRGRNKGEAFEVNNLGLRGEDTTREKPTGVLRIAAVGGSLTMAAGVPLAESWPEALERRLNESLGAAGAWEVLNLGVPNTRRCLVRHLQRAIYFEPDLILWQLGTVGTPIQFAGNFARAAEFSKKYEVPILAFALNADRHEAPESDTFQILEALGVLHGPEHFLYPSDPHPDGEIHELYAQRLLERFQERGDEFLALVQAPRPRPQSKFQPPELKPWVDPDRGFWHCYLWERATESAKATGQRVANFKRWAIQLESRVRNQLASI